MGVWGCGAAAPQRDDPQALFIMSERYGVNYYLYRDQLEQLGWTVTIAGLTDTVVTCPPYGEQLHVPPLTVDLLVGDVSDVGAYDCVALMTSTQFFSDDPFRDVMESPTAMALLADAHVAGIPVFASCSAVRVLADAGLIAGMGVVGAPKFAAEYEAAGATFLGGDHPASNTNGIITAARGMYYSLQNMAAIARAHETRLGLVEGRRRTADLTLRPVELSLCPATGDDNAAAGPGAGNPEWAVAIDSGRSDAARAVCASGDGGCFVVGYTFGAGDGEADLLAARLDAGGSALWLRGVGGAGMEYGLGCATLDDGFVAVGFTTSEGSGGRDALVMRFNDRGRVLWSRSYGGERDEVATAVVPTADGFAVCGYTTSEGAGEDDAFLLLLDADGAERSMTTYGGERSEVATAVTALPDGGFLVAASTGTYGEGNSNYYLVRTDAGGVELWTRSYGTAGPFGHGYDWCTGMAMSGTSGAGGGCVLVGYSDCQDLMDAHIVSMNADGEEAWSASRGPTIFYDYAYGVCASGDGVAVCGANKAFDGIDSVYLLEFLFDGTLLGERTFRAETSCWGSAVCSSASAGDDDPSLFVAGHIGSASSDLHDALVMRLPVTTRASSTR